MTTIYLDNAATTRVATEVTDIMATCMREDYGNPSSAHAFGLAAQRRVKAARQALANVIGDDHGDLGHVCFTSGGTEANALGVLGPARARDNVGKHAVCTAIEHPSVLGSLDILIRDGWHIDRVPVGGNGVVDPAAVSAAMTTQTQLVAIMLVNNEIGTVQPVKTIAAELAGRAHLHCDAVQALGKIPIDVTALGADTIAVSGHKLHGPKGVGALWLRNNARLAPLWAGGGQQRGVRSGTENVPGIAGLGMAATLAHNALVSRSLAWREMQRTLIHTLTESGVDVTVHGAGADRAPNIVSLALPGVPAEPALHALEALGVMVSAGSACASNNGRPSHTLRALSIPEDVGTLRVSFGLDTTLDEVKQAAMHMIAAVHEVRQ